MSIAAGLFSSGSRRRSGGGVAEVSTFTFFGEPINMIGLYFTIGVPTGQAYVWFNRDNSAEDPAPAGFVRGLAIDPGDISYGDAEQNRTIYANSMVANFNLFDPDYTATRNGNVVTITARTTGARTDIGQGTISVLNASVAVMTQGS